MQEEIRQRLGRHLNTGEYASMVGAVVAVVKEAYVPRRAYRLQELEQGAWTLWKLEPVEALVLELARLAADHVTHVQLRRLIVGHVVHGEARIAQHFDQRGPLGLSVGEG